MISFLIEQPGFALVMSIILGLIFGSFATMASYRLPRGEDLILKPSYCPSCHTRLKAADLIPLFSWLFNGRKCRYCDTPIPARYPAIEIIMALGFAASYLAIGISTDLLLVWLFWLLTVIIATVEHEKRYAPLPIAIALSVLGFVILLNHVNLYLTLVAIATMLSLVVYLCLLRVYDFPQSPAYYVLVIGLPISAIHFDMAVFMISLMISTLVLSTREILKRKKRTIHIAAVIAFSFFVSCLSYFYNA